MLLELLLLMNHWPLESSPRIYYGRNWNKLRLEVDSQIHGSPVYLVFGFNGYWDTQYGLCLKTLKYLNAGSWIRYTFVIPPPAHSKVRLLRFSGVVELNRFPFISMKVKLSNTNVNLLRSDFFKFRISTSVCTHQNVVNPILCVMCKSRLLPFNWILNIFIARGWYYMVKHLFTLCSIH